MYNLTRPDLDCGDLYRDHDADQQALNEADEKDYQKGIAMTQTCQRCYRVVERACQNDTETRDCRNLRDEERTPIRVTHANMFSIDALCVSLKNPNLCCDVKDEDIAQILAALATRFRDDSRQMWLAAEEAAPNERLEDEANAAQLTATATQLESLIGFYKP